MQDRNNARVDKWLWAVRIFKTRSLATEACRKGRVFVNGLEAKASHDVKAGDTVVVRKLPVVHTLRVRSLTCNRLPAKLVNEYMEDLTSLEELDKLKINRGSFLVRDRGSGRPTKRERRKMDEIFNQTQ